jgi:hypothetical protein
MELAPTVPYPAYRLLDARPMENILRKSDFEFFDGPMWVLPDGIKSRSLKDYPNDFIGIRRVKAVAEFHGDGIHDGEILDGKLAEHGTNLTGRRLIFNQWLARPSPGVHGLFDFAGLFFAYRGSPSWTPLITDINLAHRNQEYNCAGSDLNEIECLYLKPKQWRDCFSNYQ